VPSLDTLRAALERLISLVPRLELVAAGTAPPWLHLSEEAQISELHDGDPPPPSGDGGSADDSPDPADPGDPGDPGPQPPEDGSNFSIRGWMRGLLKGDDDGPVADGGAEPTEGHDTTLDPPIPTSTVEPATVEPATTTVEPVSSDDDELDDVRRRLEESERVIDAVREGATAEVQRLQDRLRAREAELVVTIAQASNLTDALRDTEERAARRTHERLEGERAAARTTIADLTSRLREVEVDRDESRVGFAELRDQTDQEMQEAVAAIDDLRDAAKRAADNLHDAQRREAELRERGTQLDAELATERTHNQTLTAGMQKRIDTLTREREALTVLLSTKSAEAEELADKARAFASTAKKRDIDAQRMSQLAGERETELAHIRGEIEARTTELSEARQNARLKEHAARELTAALRALQIDKETREREYITLRSRLETEQTELQTTLEDRDRRLKALQESVDKAEMRSLEHEDRVKAARAQVDELRTRHQRDLAEKDVEIRAMRDSVTTRERQLDRDRTELTVRDKQRAEESAKIEARLDDKDAQIKELLQLMQGRTEKLKKAEVERDDANARISTLESQAQAHQDRSKQLGAKLNERSEKLTQTEMQLRDARTRLRDAEARARNVADAHAQVEDQLHPLASELQERSKRVTGLESALASAEENRREHQARARALESELKQTTNARGQTDTDVSDLRTALAEAERIQVVLKGETKQLEAELEERSGRLAELELGMLDASPETLGATRDEQVERLRAELTRRDQQMDVLRTELEQAERGAALAVAAATAKGSGPDRPSGARWLGRAAALAAAVGGVAVIGFGASELLGPPRPANMSGWVASGAVAPTLSLAGPGDQDRAAALVRSWATAIEQRHWRELLGLYDGDFHPRHLADRDEFERETIELLRTADWLAVGFDQLEVRTTDDGELVVTFPLELRAAGHLEMGRRQLWLAGDTDQLRIHDDRWVP